MPRLHNSFRFLNPALPAALACVRVYAPAAVLGFAPNQKRPILLRLAGVDECLVLTEAPDNHLLCLHGGQGVRGAFLEWAVGLGLTEEMSVAADDSFRSPHPYAARALELVPDAPHQAALRLLLEAASLPPEASARSADPIQLAIVERWLSLPRVAIVGPPNAGKSSLFNRLAAARSAIVNASAGTTRDWLEAHCILPGGLACTIIDTAGIRRDAQSASEAAGMELGRTEAARADLRLHLWPVDADDLPPRYEAWLANEKANSDVPVDSLNGLLRDLPIITKTDLAPAPAGFTGISTTNGHGIGELKTLLTKLLFPPLPSTRPLPLPPSTEASHPQ